jgi:hypothetical protein
MIRKIIEPKQNLPKHPFRKNCNYMVGSTIFEITITMCIFMNTIVMAMRYYRMPEDYETALEQTNNIFAVIFNVECFMKLAALGRYYFSNSWNK